MAGCFCDRDTCSWAEWADLGGAVKLLNDEDVIVTEAIMGAWSLLEELQEQIVRYLSATHVHWLPSTPSISLQYTT